jgi:prepilin-type N-terminal cleavage/methylation domain-containing protein
MTRTKTLAMRHRGPISAKRLEDQSGYSLVEVMVSIVILAIAIIPMVGMFDAGLKAANTSGDYDKARALANLMLEQAKGLPYEEVRDDFPAGSTTPDGSGSYTDPSRRTYAGPNSADFAGFEYKVDKQYLDRPPTGSDSDPAPATQNFGNSTVDDGLIKVTVTVRWGNDKTYSTTGVVANGSP